MTSSKFGSTELEASDAPRVSDPAVVETPSVLPRRVWIFVDFDMFKHAGGLVGRDLESAWNRWFVIAESRNGLWGPPGNPKIDLELEVTCWPSSISVSASELPRVESPGGLSSSSTSPGTRSDAVWLWFDFDLYRRASGLTGYQLHSSWARWWVLAESRNGIWGTFEAPSIAVAIEELGFRD